VRELDELVAIVPSVQAPTLVLADPNDKVVPLHTARRLAQDLPNGRLQLIKGAGHHLPRRAPGAVADAIAAFLTAIDSGRTARVG
jgi:pimeloyl-ACP methyl ester carboxylesterase